MAEAVNNASRSNGDGGAAAAAAAPVPADSSAAIAAADHQESLWTRLQLAGVTIPTDIIDKLAELDLELSEGEEDDNGRCVFP